MEDCLSRLVRRLERLDEKRALHFEKMEVHLRKIENRLAKSDQHSRAMTTLMNEREKPIVEQRAKMTEENEEKPIVEQSAEMTEENEVNVEDIHDLVGNGAKLPCSGKFDQLAILVQGYTFQVDCYLLPIQGADLVLGVQWLAQLGPCTMDYGSMSMSFTMGEQLVQLQGLQDFNYSSATSFQLLKLEQHDEVVGSWLAIAEPVDKEENSRPKLVEGFRPLVEDFTGAYPSFDLEGKVGPQGGSNVTATMPFWRIGIG